MQKKQIKIDFDKKCGKIKPMHCINGGPRSGGYDLPFDLSEEMSAMGVPFVRTVGFAGEYGYNQYINIHCIFPDFSADEQLEESYNFLPTDLYLASIKGCGADIFFRLGESREPYARKLYTAPPADPAKWARICEHIIMHYNEGWANGFKLNIKNWEIWSAPDSFECWSGEAQEYYELYRVCANHLKERFPKIKVGAYGAGGFYSLNRLDATEEMKGYIPFMQKFLAYITSEQTRAPLDFFTWCCYTSNPDEIYTHSQYARSYLDSAGLRRARSIICEYNTTRTGELPPALRQGYAAEVGMALINGQKSSADMMMYSTSDVNSAENGLYTIDDRHSVHRYAAFNVMCAYSGLYRLGTAVDSGDDHRKEVYTLAAYNGKEGAIMTVIGRYEGRLELLLNGSAFDACTVVKVSPDGERGKGTVYRSRELAVSGGKLALSVKPGEIYTVNLYTK